MLLLENDRVSESDAPLRRCAGELEAAAAAHYRRSALGACADCYLALERIARALDDERTALRARFWHATALHGLGLHEEALVGMEGHGTRS